MTEHELNVRQGEINQKVHDRIQDQLEPEEYSELIKDDLIELGGQFFDKLEVLYIMEECEEEVDAEIRQAPEAFQKLCELYLPKGKL